MSMSISATASGSSGKQADLTRGMIFRFYVLEVVSAKKLGC
jgi:hypothetical protein